MTGCCPLNSENPSTEEGGSPQLLVNQSSLSIGEVILPE